MAAPPGRSTSERGRYYLHNFALGQPDLDWWNPEVREEFERILRFWFDRGVAGFRIDVAHGLIKDRDLRDDPPATDEDDARTRALGVRHVFSLNRPETHEILRDWRRLADSYEPPRVLVGEVYVLDTAAWALYYGSGSDELNLAFNVALVHAGLEAEQMRTIVACDGGGAARGSLALLDGFEPRRRAPHDPLVPRRRGPRTLRTAGAADAARDAVPLLRR